MNDVLDKIAGVEVNAKTADARKTIFNSRPLDDALISDLIKESGAVELKAYGGSCTSLVFSALQATGVRFEPAAAFIQISACARHAKAECEARQYTAEFCKGLREGF
jgi:hypothetical protein